MLTEKQDIQFYNVLMAIIKEGEMSKFRVFDKHCKEVEESDRELREKVRNLENHNRDLTTPLKIS